MTVLNMVVMLIGLAALLALVAATGGPSWPGRRSREIVLVQRRDGVHAIPRAEAERWLDRSHHTPVARAHPPVLLWLTSSLALLLLLRVALA